MMRLSMQNYREQKVDELLRAYFKKEMPDPWPGFVSAEPAPSNPRKQSRFLFRGRLALVASVAVIFFGYQTISPLFKTDGDDGIVIDRGQIIGSALNIHQKRELTPRGAEVILWEDSIPGDRPIIIINVKEIKG